MKPIASGFRAGASKQPAPPMNRHQRRAAEALRRRAYRAITKQAERIERVLVGFGRAVQAFALAAGHDVFGLGRLGDEDLDA